MKLILSASILVAVLGAVCFSNCLDGRFVYDDHVAILRNPVVNGQAPLQEVWKRDYWGEILTSPESHKSWRPITTLTFRWNYNRSGVQSSSSGSPQSMSFHLVARACRSESAELGEARQNVSVSVPISSQCRSRR